MSSFCGFIRINKVAGISSFRALSPVKRFFKGAKVGHAGTLDPDATGLLIVAIGPATRLLSYAEAWDKTYAFRLYLGFQTDTLDLSGEVLQIAPVPSLGVEQIEAVLAQFRGEIEQTPPMYSAIKINGQRAYDLARKGQAVELKSRRVHIISLEYLAQGRDEHGIWLDLRTRCSKGTYVRSLGADLARRWGTVGTVDRIHREAIGEHDLLGAAQGDEVDWQNSLQTVETFVPLPKIQVPDAQMERMLLGNAQKVPSDQMWAVGDFAFVCNMENQAQVLAEFQGEQWQPRVRLV